MEKFLSAFSKLDCKDKLKTTYESVMVERISASRSKNMVFVYCQNGEWMPYRVIHQMEQQLYKQIFRPMGFHPQIQISGSWKTYPFTDFRADGAGYQTGTPGD